MFPKTKVTSYHIISKVSLVTIPLFLSATQLPELKKQYSINYHHYHKLLTTTIYCSNEGNITLYCETDESQRHASAAKDTLFK